MDRQCLQLRPFNMASFTLIVVLTSALIGCSSDESSSTTEQSSRAEDESIAQSTATTETVYVSADYEPWVLNTDELVKHVDDIYIGTVLSAGETFSIDYSIAGHGDVWTPFAVKVEQRLLGSVDGAITLVQYGGYDPARDILVIGEEDPLLEVGETYMLASLSNPNRRPEEAEYNFLVPFKGRIRIENAAHRQQLIQEYTAAITQAGLGS